jgi:alanine racemase
VLSQDYKTKLQPPKYYPFESSQVMCHRAWVEINQKNLGENIKEIKAFLAPHTSLMAVVKADAYGHGALSASQTALKAGATWLAIATLGEGIELRQGGITAPILVLGAINTPEEIEALVRWQLQPTLCNPQQAFILSETLGGLHTPLPVHLKLDTGMSRLGMLWDQAWEFVQLVHQLPYLNIESIYSHFATADDPDPLVMNLQHQRFTEAIAKIKEKGIKIPLLHIANSAATLSDRTLHYDLVRVGLAMYGLYPAPHLKDKVNLKPVLQVKAKITQVKTLPPNQGVSYGHKFKTTKETPIAVVGIGYADGIPRNLSNQLQVLVRGQKIPQIGAITMDQLMLDVSSIPDIQTGEVVTLIGKDGNYEISADDWADQIGTISWEILCSFKHRLPRVNCY